jgi:class 3 adenylate cyclase/tetratricopeptide (TPR) repeat protein
MMCSRCSSPNPDGAKFCSECGTPLARVCPSCGHPASGKFCNECGTPLTETATSAATGPAPGPVSERRTTTVLFGDLVGFTTLSESRDPEEVRDLLSQYFAVARTVVGRYGGTIEKFIGDAVMAVWGVPVAHEDDAERAVRAGLDLVAEVAALGESVGAAELSMRVGIVTGSVAVTLGATHEGMVAGDAVNTAARVQTAAAPGTVWVDQETYGLTSAAVAFTDMGEHGLKGKAEPARLFRADTVVAAVGGAQRVDGLEAPLAGRERELRQVRELFHATQEDGRARVAVVTGVAGIGKSRLGWEFEKYADGLTHDFFWHRGRCLSYGDGVAFWAFAEMIRSRLGLLETDDQAEVDEKVRTGVAAVAATPAEAAWLAPRVAALLNSGEEGVHFDRTDLFASWTTFLERVGGEHPVVLLFEDTQHADNGLLDLVEHLLEASRARLFVLVLARPELLERRPSLATSRRSTLVHLEPLPDTAMTNLVDGLVDDLPARARAALVARAEGVPLYAVETVRSLIDHDAVVARDGRYVFVDHDHTLVDLDQLVAPTSLQTLIAARLDALTPAERRAVQDASVLGVTFRRTALEALSELRAQELDVALSALERKGVLETQNNPRSPELGQYRFLQAIVREVAYSTLARKDRRARHLAAATHLEGEEVAESLSGIIAQQLLDALDASSPDDPELAAIRARARSLLTAAADRAQALGSPEEALRSTLSALELDPEPREEAELALRACRAAFFAGAPRRAEELATVAAERYRAVSEPGGAAAALVVQGRALMNQGRHSEAAASVEAGLDAAGEGGPEVGDGVRIELLMVRGACARALGNFELQQASAMEMLGMAEDLQDPGLLVRALNGLGLMLIDAGSSTAYLAVLERAIKIARDGRLLGELSRSLVNLCSETYPDDLDAAAEISAEGISVARQVGESTQMETGLINAGFTWWLRGDWDLLTSEVSEWFEGREPTATASTVWLGLTLVRQARGEPVPRPALPMSEDRYERLGAGLVAALGEAEDGDLHAAATQAAEVFLGLYGSGETNEDFEVHLGPTVELLIRAGDLGTAADLLTLAAPLLGGRARRLTRAEVPRIRGLLALARGEDPEEDLRAAERAHEAYGAPYLLARTRLALARWLLSQGRGREAEEMLALARPVFVELRAAPSVDEVDALAGVTASAGGR